MPVAQATRPKAKTRARGYGHKHEALRRQWKPVVESGRCRCARCGDVINPAEGWDLGHVDGSKTLYHGPEHRRCNRGAPKQRWTVDPRLMVVERPGLEAADPRWRVPWLQGLRRVPANATWPRYMTVPHPAAVGSLGKEFVRFAEDRSGRELRWWQKLVATRLLEVDDQERLVWETVVLTMARQLGKSWLLRELLFWRIHQGDRFGEPQDVMHTGKDLAVCKEVQRPARIWAKQRKDKFKVREVNGQEEIELLSDGSRWMLRAKEAVYGYGVSVGAADEAWKVRAATIEEGLAPTMVEREQPQMLLVSTAHRRATQLMLEHRKLALASLEQGDGDLLVEWSAPSDCELDDVAAWRLASPYWTVKRERLIAKRLQLAESGEADPDPEEPDPIESFRAQWLNQWPLTSSVVGEELLPPGMWDRLKESGLTTTGGVFVAVEDFYGKGAAVATAARLEDGRIDVGGWLRDDWDTAIRQDVEWLGSQFQIRQLLVGASMLNSVPTGTTPQPSPAGTRETRVGLALFRDLAARGMLTHDHLTKELDRAVTLARVREAQTGLTLPATDNSHLVKAVVWAVNAAHAPVPMPAVV